MRRDGQRSASRSAAARAGSARCGARALCRRRSRPFSSSPARRPIVPTHDVVLSGPRAQRRCSSCCSSASWRGRRNASSGRGAPGRRRRGLHVRVVGLFSLVALLPAILVAVVASVTLERGLEPWFSGLDHRSSSTTRSRSRDAYRDLQCRTLGARNRSSWRPTSTRAKAALRRRPAAVSRFHRTHARSPSAFRWR